MFQERDPQGQVHELSRRSLVGVDFKTLTGFEQPECLLPLPPIQITLTLAA
jgi:hypothetical protein